MVILLKIIAIALVTVFASMIVKQLKPEIAVFITLVGSVLIITIYQTFVILHMLQYIILQIICDVLMSNN